MTNRCSAITGYPTSLSLFNIPDKLKFVGHLISNRPATAPGLLDNVPSGR